MSKWYQDKDKLILLGYTTLAIAYTVLIVARVKKIKGK